MNDRAKLKADLIAGNSTENEILPEKTKGKAFVEALDRCETPEDVINLLCKTMPLDKIKDRAGYVTDNPLVLNLKKAALEQNIKGGYEPRHGEKVMLAIERGSQLTEGGLQGFKNVLNKSIAAREQAQMRVMTQRAMG